MLTLIADALATERIDETAAMLAAVLAAEAASTVTSALVQNAGC